MCYVDGTLWTEKLFLLNYVLFLYGLGILFPVFLFLLLELIHTDRDQYPQQWRIQHFPDGGGASSPDFGAKIYYFTTFLPKTAWKWKKLNRGPVPGAPLEPPMKKFTMGLRNDSLSIRHWDWVWEYSVLYVHCYFLSVSLGECDGNISLWPKSYYQFLFIRLHVGCQNEKLFHFVGVIHFEIQRNLWPQLCVHLNACIIFPQNVMSAEGRSR